MTLTKDAAYAALLDNQLIQGLSPDQAQMFYENGKIVRAKPGTVFISEGSVNKHIYLVLSGELEVFLPDNENRFSKITLAMRTPGHYVGEYSFLDSSTASASVKTTQETVLFQIPHDAAEDLFNATPDIGRVIYRNLLLNLVTRLRESDQELDMIQPFT